MLFLKKNKMFLGYLLDQSVIHMVDKDANIPLIMNKIIGVGFCMKYMI